MRIIRLPELETKVGWSGQNIYRKVRAGLFPKPVQLGNQTVGWIEAEIDDWITARIKERDNPSPQTSAIREANLARARVGKASQVARRADADAERLARMAAEPKPKRRKRADTASPPT